MCHTNMRLSFVTKADAFLLILNKLGCAERSSVYFLSSSEPGARLSDVGVFHFTRSKITIYEHVSDLYLLFEFFKMDAEVSGFPSPKQSSVGSVFVCFNIMATRRSLKSTELIMVAACLKKSAFQKLCIP
jgi:hypothetical protein